MTLVWPDPADEDTTPTETATDTSTTTETVTETTTDTDTTPTDMGPAESASNYVVQSGDTLWRIAAHCYGEGRRWPEIWDANRDRVMGDGRTFSNANLIRVGWTLSVPGECAGE